MVWRTQLGERILEGVEAESYLDALYSALHDLQVLQTIDEEQDWLTGDRIFDTANFNQKVVLMYACLEALLRPEIPAPTLTNVMEAATYAPFAYVRERIFEEIEDERTEDFTEGEEAMKYGYRLMVWKPFEALILPGWLMAESEMDEFEPEAHHQEAAFDFRSTDYDLWDQVIDELADRIFLDCDWQISASHPQVLDGIEKKLGETVDLSEI